VLSLVGLAFGGYLGVLAGCQFDQGGVHFAGPDAATTSAPADAGTSAPADAAGPSGLADASTPVVEPPDAGLVCDPPLADCGPACVDLLQNRDHCGRCNHRCKKGESCQDGQCND